MFNVDKIPSWVFSLIEEKGVEADKIMLAAYCDMNADFVFCDTYVVATKDKICILSGSDVLLHNNKSEKLEKNWNEISYSEYDIEKIERLKLDEMLSSSSPFLIIDTFAV